MANYEVSRRHFLMSLFSLCTLPGAIAAVKLGELARPIPAKFPGKPEFWFGDTVRSYWLSDDDGKTHWEQGEVTGVVWDPNEKRWTYAIIWVQDDSSELSNFYPCFDDRLTDSEGIEKVLS
jgi:hypothetical protein